MTMPQIRSPPKSSVTITVTDVNEADPAFATETATRMDGAENTAAGEDIGAPVVQRRMLTAATH